MNTHISDALTYTDKEYKDAAKQVINMIKSPNSGIRKFKDGSCDVYEVSDGKNKSTIVNRKMDPNDPGCWVIFSGKFEKMGIGPFNDESPFSQQITDGTGIKKIINNKIAIQQTKFMEKNR